MLVLSSTMSKLHIYVRVKRTHPGKIAWLKHCTRIGYAIIIASFRSYLSTRLHGFQMPSCFFPFVPIPTQLLYSRALHALHASHVFVYTHFSIVLAYVILLLLCSVSIYLISYCMQSIFNVILIFSS